ncbi:hypothetical protein LINGRAHAP2_LOCUS15391, partial [Linum grandiflorum]
AVLEYDGSTNRVPALLFECALNCEETRPTIKPSKILIASGYSRGGPRVSIRVAVVELSIAVNVPWAYLRIFHKAIDEMFHLVVVIFTRRFPCANRRANEGLVWKFCLHDDTNRNHAQKQNCIQFGRAGIHDFLPVAACIYFRSCGMVVSMLFI